MQTLRIGSILVDLHGCCASGLSQGTILRSGISVERTDWNVVCKVADEKFVAFFSEKVGLSSSARLERNKAD